MRNPRIILLLLFLAFAGHAVEHHLEPLEFCEGPTAHAAHGDCEFCQSAAETTTILESPEAGSHFLCEQRVDAVWAGRLVRCFDGRAPPLSS